MDSHSFDGVAGVVTWLICVSLLPHVTKPAFFILDQLPGVLLPFDSLRLEFLGQIGILTVVFCLGE